ncbi:non-ribosomal peptide synthetase [Streptomyces xiaopingdaonensis]|uniref:non-ribosomal peptide synthetase n=1 Tax=Streptomyces xiaopingdaonensis TaxID=1565415 RepID=UPI00036C9839|nr:non-ribosomal peptide synthetase [Streptomyces xiaopingdaonensis]
MVKHDDSIPVTASQHDLLFVQEAASRKDLYNNSFRIVFDGAVEAGPMRSALERLVRHQPALRTEFAMTDGAFRARLAEPGEVPLEVVRQEGPAEEWEAFLRSGTEEFVRQPLDLGRAPLCRFRLLVGTDESGERTALLATVHHTVSDGVSVRVLVDEICDGYRLATGRTTAETAHESRPEERERWLRAELRAQREAADAAVAAGEGDALAKTLAGVAPTALYRVPDRPQDTRFSAARLSVLLSHAQRGQVEAAARQSATTPFAVLLSCYALLLGDYSGNPDVIVGSPFATRRTVASHRLCGFFVNTLPMALPARDRPFDEHLREVSATVRETRARQSVPFDALVSRTAVDRTSNRNPVFQCMFAMQDELRTRVSPVPWIEGRVEIVDNGSAKFDLWLGATPVEDGLRIDLDYDQDLLPESYARRFLAEFQELLLRAVETPTAHTGSLLGALGPRTARAAAELRTGADADAGTEHGLLGLVLDAAREYPGNVAVTEPGGPGTTYAELRERTARVAAGLLARGVRRGDTVGIVPASLPDTVVAMLAVLWCGAAYLPVDTSLPTERLEYMLEQSGCRFVVGDRQVVAGEPPRAAVGELQEEGAGLPEPGLPDGSDPVYIMFTSGSTGRPKGVHLGQDPLVNLLRWQLREMRMGPGTRFLQFAPLGFDVSYQEIFPTLACGGTVFGLGTVDRRDLGAVAGIAERERLTHVYLPVAVLGAFCGAVAESGLRLPTVRFLCVSGEQLHLDDRVRRLLTEDPGRVLINLYGPTETTAVTWHVLRGDRLPAHNHVPIGRPVPGVDAHLLGPDGRDVPPGAVGELFLGGVCPAVGYINDPERTEAAFLPAPGADPGSGARVYRTGDLALLTEDGDLVFLGRRDAQVKVRGHRVELGEIESATQRLPEVAAAAAAVHGTGEEAALCLFVRFEPGAEADDRRIRAHLEQALPSYMIPRHVRSIDAVPLTPNGKVDRKALLAAFESGSLQAVANGGTVPGWEPTGTEAMVRALWTDLLSTEPTGPDDSFFVLGGNSFDALQLVSSLRESTGTSLAIADFFRRPTIRALAAHLDEAA